jgi:hypothetical protein
MANIQPKWVGIPDAGARDGVVVTWGPMANGDIGVAVDDQSNVSGHADRTVQAEGVFGAGGNVAITGSIDGVNYEVLNDPSSTPLNITSPKIRSILEAPRSIRPQVTAGDGTTSVTVSIFMRKLR